MTPEKTWGDKGSYRFDEEVPGVGRIRIKSAAYTQRDHAQRVGLLRKLRDQGRLDLLKALHAGTISILELLDADRRNQLPMLVADLYGARSLQPAVNKALDAMTAAPATVATYRKSWRALYASQALPRRAKVRDLAKVDWKGLDARWGRSGTSWMQMRRAVSRTLTVMLGGRDHPLRVLVVGKIPRRKENERVPDLSPVEFRRIIANLEKPYQGPIMLLAMTGMRSGEYEVLTAAHLGNHLIRVPGSKGDKSWRELPIAPALWGWVKAAVPCPVSIWTLRRRWNQAVDAAGVEPLHLHDLRHCTAQWLSDAGRPLPSLMVTLGHANINQTMKYAKRRLRQDDAEAMAAVLAPRVGTQVKRSKGRKRA